MERPTFYAVIPAFVRYADISSDAKLMYGEVTALCEKEGYCWASNGYFANLYKANERTIRRWITELVKAGFVTVDLAANQYGQRRIFITTARTNVPGQTSPDKIARHNNPSKNNDTREDIPSVSPQPTKATKRGQLPLTSLAEIIGDAERLPAEWANAIAAKGASQQWIDEQWERFCNHHVGKGTKWRDWRRAWLNWCAGSKERSGGRTNGTGAGGGLAAAMRSSFLARNGAAQSGGSVGGGQGTDTSGADGGGESPRLVGGEIPF